MSTEQLAAIMSRTDAAAGFLMALMLDYGVISLADLEARLNQAEAEALKANNGEIVASVFKGMKTLLAQHHPKPFTH